MALFGGDMVTVQTPDGRVIQMPSQLAQAFPGLQVQQPPPDLSLNQTGPASPPTGMPPTAAPQQMPPEQPPPEPAPAPQQSPVAVPMPAAPVLASPDTVTPPVTTADLQASGPAGVLNEEGKAKDEAIAGGTRLADEQALFQTKMGAAYAARNAKIEQDMTAKAAAADANLNEINAKAANIDTEIKKYSDMKIDRSVDHPILAALGIALSSIGTAMLHQTENPAIAIVMKGIENKVATQVANKQGAANAIGMQRDSLAGLRQKFTDRNAYYDGLMAAETQRTINLGDELAAKSQSKQVQANWQIQRAALYESYAEHRGTAIDKQHAWDQADRAFKAEQANKKAEIGIQYGHLALARKGLDEQIREHDLMRQDKLDDIALGYAKLGQADKAAKAKEVATTGVFDPSSGAAVLDPAGQASLDKADTIERAARTASTPEQAAALRQQAEQLRTDAEVNHGFTIADKDIRKDVIKKVGASQNLMDTIAGIKRTLAQDPSSIDRETWAGLGTDFERAKTAWIEAHGAKVSSREMQAVEEMFGTSPDSLMLRVTSRGKMLARLNKLEQGTISETTNELGANGYKGQWRPRPIKDETPEQLTGTTSIERGADATPGLLGRAFYPAKSPTQKQIEGENAGPITPTGLSPEDTSTVQSLAKKWDASNDKGRAQIESTLSGFAQSPRESIANGSLSLLKAENPEVFSRVMSAMPKNVQAAAQTQAAQVKAATPLDVLKQGALGGNTDDATEIFRRSTAGDMAAKKVVQDIIKARRK